MKKSKNIRRNAKLYPVYKMFSWDLLFFYSIEYLFYTTAKNITVSQVLIANAFYLTFKVIGQIPATIIIDYIGKRKSMILRKYYNVISSNIAHICSRIIWTNISKFYVCFWI